MKKLIGVSGSNRGDKHLNLKILKLAEEVGSLIAEKDAVLVCGGMAGIMEAAARGAKKAGGLTLGILPRGKDKANKYIDIAIPTHLGYSRNYLLVNAVDSLIAICGRWGTLNEITFSLIQGKPTIILVGTSGVADLLGGIDLGIFERKPVFAKTPEEAVRLAFNAI